MAETKVPMPFRMVWATSTTALFHPSSYWMSTSTVKKVRSAFELALIESDVSVSAAYQTANVENSPDTPTAIGSYATTNGVSYPSGLTDISAQLEQKQLVRFGWLVKNTASGTKNFVVVGGFISVSDT